MVKEGEIDTRREGVVVVLASGDQPRRAESRQPNFVPINPVEASNIACDYHTN